MKTDLTLVECEQSKPIACRLKHKQGYEETGGCLKDDGERQANLKRAGRTILEWSVAVFVAHPAGPLDVDACTLSSHDIKFRSKESFLEWRDKVGRISALRKEERMMDAKNSSHSVPSLAAVRRCSGQLIISTAYGKRQDQVANNIKYTV